MDVDDPFEAVPGGYGYEDSSESEVVYQIFGS